MDGDSFDRLSVVVHRLRERVTRRGALAVLLGGAVAATFGLVAEESDAKRRKKKKCRGFGGRCDSSRDCCDGRCRNGFCFPDGGGGGGGGGRHCNGVRCPSGWSCCRFNGFEQCRPNNDSVCFNDTCPIGWVRCGGDFRCCGPNQRCCGNGRCCPEDWFCGDVACYANQNAEIGSESADSVPYAEPATFDGSEESS